jgi:hypothetical protein
MYMGPQRKLLRLMQPMKSISALVGLAPRKSVSRYRSP